MKKREELRWSIYRAAVEFDVDGHWLSKQIAANGVQAGADGHFSTAQIVAAIYGDLEKEKIGLTRAQKELAELKLKQKQGELGPIKLMANVWDRITVEWRQRVSYWPIPELLKTECLKDLQNVPVSEYAAIAARALDPDDSGQPEES